MIETSLNKSMPIKRGSLTPDNILSFIEKEYDAGNKENVMKLAKMMNDKCISLSREYKALKGEYKMSDVMNLDDMLEAGDNNRVDNIEGVHGLIAFLLNNTNEFDIEAEVFEIIINRWSYFSDTWKRDFYEFLDDDDFAKCEECRKFFRKEDTFLCEHDERVCKDCCGNREKSGGER